MLGSVGNHPMFRGSVALLAIRSGAIGRHHPITRNEYLLRPGDDTRRKARQYGSGRIDHV